MLTCIASVKPANDNEGKAQVTHLNHSHSSFSPYPIYSHPPHQHSNPFVYSSRKHQKMASATISTFQIRFALGTGHKSHFLRSFLPCLANFIFKNTRRNKSLQNKRIKKETCKSPLKSEGKNCFLFSLEKEKK